MMNRHLKRLYLSNNNLGDTGVTIVADGLKRNTYLGMIGLSNCSL